MTFFYQRGSSVLKTVRTKIDCLLCNVNNKRKKLCEERGKSNSFMLQKTTFIKENNNNKNPSSRDSLFLFFPLAIPNLQTAKMARFVEVKSFIAAQIGAQVWSCLHKTKTKPKPEPKNLKSTTQPPPTEKKKLKKKERKRTFKKQG